MKIHRDRPRPFLNQRNNQRRQPINQPVMETIKEVSSKVRVMRMHVMRALLVRATRLLVALSAGVRRRSIEGARTGWCSRR